MIQMGRCNKLKIKENQATLVRVLQNVLASCCKQTSGGCTYPRISKQTEQILTAIP